jgi:hypothetical protein
MGPSGSGKSTVRNTSPYTPAQYLLFIVFYIKFINTVAKNSNIAVGHGLESCTSDISTVRLSFPERTASDIVFVDTPGFDHTNKTEADVLKMVADWLKTTYVLFWRLKL